MDFLLYLRVLVNEHLFQYAVDLVANYIYI